MQHKKYVLAAAVFFITLASSSAQYQVFDASNWLTAIDQLYTGYDIVTNTIKRIEQGYKQLQYYYDAAQNWKFDDIQWDGDFDFRDEIRQANRSVNRQLTNIRRIKEILTEETFSMGDESYTMKDVCGFGDADKNLFDLVKQTGKVNQTAFENAASTFEKNLSYKEKEKIWRKYGISPKNFAMVYGIEKQLNPLMQEQIAQATDKAEELKRQNSAERSNAITSEILTAEDQNPTQVAQKTALLINQLVEQLSDLGISLDKASGFTVWKYQLDRQEKQNEREKQLYEEKTMRKDDSPDSIFSAG